MATEKPVINHPAQDCNSARKLTGAAPIVNQAIAVASMVIAFGLAWTVAAQQRTGRELTASSLKQQLLGLESKETELRMRLEELDEQLNPESIERELAGIGSTHPEELREHRRKLLIIERNGLQKQLNLLEEDRARIEAAIAEAESTTDSPDALPSPAPLPKRVTEMALDNFGTCRSF
jgi:chaperonin cofactor prefoldin